MFTPHNCFWQTAEAVPVMGLPFDAPRSGETNLTWFIESGVTLRIADWSNNIWTAREWKPGIGTRELTATSHVMLVEMAKMRTEGYVVPKMTFLTGIDYARPEGPKVVNWPARLHLAGVRKQSGRPTAACGRSSTGSRSFCAGLRGIIREVQKISFHPRFTIRYQGAQQDHTRTNELGLWSWMDHG